MSESEAKPQLLSQKIASFFEFTIQDKQEPPKLVENVCDDLEPKVEPKKASSFDFFELKKGDSLSLDTKFSSECSSTHSHHNHHSHNHSDCKDSTSTSSPTSAKKQYKFSCKICGQQFEKSQQLGGHQSKRHPNQSSIYKSKQIRRNERKDDRQLLSVTKRYLRKLYPTIEFNDMRSKIQQFRMKVLKNCKDNELTLDEAG